jgi:hypothetical protein
LTSIPVIVNPTAGGGRLLRRQGELSAAARGLDVELSWWLTEQRGHGEELARRAAAANHPLVLAWGGALPTTKWRGLVGSATAMERAPGRHDLGLRLRARRATPRRGRSFLLRGR